jgi:hypothetical protein
MKVHGPGVFHDGHLRDVDFDHAIEGSKSAARFRPSGSQVKLMRKRDVPGVFLT